MSGSETGILTSREPFSVGLQSQPVLQNVRLSFSPDGTAIYKPSSPTSSSYQSSGAGNAVDYASADGAIVPHGINNNIGSEPMKRKRGRPRKYGPDGSMALALTPVPPSINTTTQPSGGFSSSPVPAPASVGPVLPTAIKKTRGRPPGSSNKKQQSEALGSAGAGFTPHIITVKAGEDVSSKIMSFSQSGSRAVCVLSANGAISNVTLRQPATSGSSVSYEGRFEILSLSGSFLLSENGGQRSRTGGLSVSLSGPDGRVLGGGVAGLLIAAAPVQVVVGSFMAEGKKEMKSAYQTEPLTSPPNMVTFSGGGPTGASSPPSRGTPSESSGGGPESPYNQSSGACNNSNPHGMSSFPWK